MARPFYMEQNGKTENNCSLGGSQSGSVVCAVAF